MKTPCILWTKSTDACGYGMRKYQGKVVRVHRIAYVIAHDLELDDIKGLLVCHRCDNPPCHNPDHLFLGTHQDNTDDRQAKGRQVVHKGEDHGRAKLTWEAVEAIRKRYVPGVITQAALAKEFGVHHTIISKVLKGQLWRTS